jgi:hypothetical protein
MMSKLKRRKPGAELEGNVAVGIGTTVPAGLGVQADGACGIDPLLADR